MKNPLSVFRKSLSHALYGIIAAIKTEWNLKIHLLLVVLVVAMGFYVSLSPVEWSIIIGCFGLVMGAELMNTAIEKLVDMVSPDINPKAGLVKDIAAGAVLICAITAAVIGCIIFIPKLLVLW